VKDNTTVQWQALPAPGARQWLVHTTDAESQARAQPDWALHYQQLSGGAFSGCVHHIELPGLRLVREDSNRALHQQGALDHQGFGLAMPLTPAGPVFFSGQPVPADSIMVGRGDVLDLVTPPQFSLIAVVVDETLLQPLWQHMYQKPTATWLNQQRVLPSRAAAVQAVRQLHLQLMAQLARTRPLARAQTQAQAQAQAQTQAQTETQEPVPPLAATSLLHARDAVLMEWLEALPEKVTDAPRPSLQQRRQLLRQALDLMHAHADEPLSMLQLCQVLGSSRRQLNYTFREQLGTSPVKYWTALRLARVRRELTQGNTTVAQAASRWGFWHLGQFACDYRLQFGELPSITLKSC
jgi:AraC family ethanolamine operon transcriptional activator